jgi:hypothetical protein
MSRVFSCILALLLFGCGEDSETSDSPPGEQTGNRTVVLRLPRNGLAILWQRSYPDEYTDLITRAHESRNPHPSNPYGGGLDGPISVPDSELTPATFGLIGWGRGIVSRAFDELGFPLVDGAEILYSPDPHTLTVTHTPKGIEAFLRRFPEFNENSEQDEDADAE